MLNSGVEPLALEGQCMKKRMFNTVLVSCLLSVQASATDWSHPGGDAGGQRYSELTQITADNLSSLEQAWEYSFSEAEAKNHKYSMQMTPLYVENGDNGHLVSCSPFGRIVAIDPESGAEKWRYDSGLDEKAVRNIFKCRGIALWTDTSKSKGAHCERRLFMAVIDRRMVSVDALTGKPCKEFGDNGIVRLYSGDKREATVFSTSPPALLGDSLIVGSQVEDFNKADMPAGSVIAIDARSGKQKWAFKAIPDQDKADGEWPAKPDSVSGAANVWAPLSVDEERNIVYVPTSAPSPDYYGVYRPGDNRYANSIVALDGSSGEVLWHFQIVHHDLWDYDVPSQPILTDIVRNGEVIPALIQTTKQGLIFMFNRVNGEPIYEIEERTVPKSLVAGEITSPTQPFPIKPKPLIKHNIGPEDAWGFTFWDEGKCRKEFEKLRNEGIYTPFGEKPAIYNPSALGGMNWGGSSVSKDEQLLIVNLSNTAMFGQLLPIDQANSSGHWNPALTQINAMKGTPYAIVMGAIASPLGIPCSPPPWGKLAAVDISTGDIKWEVTLGSVHEMGPIAAPFEIELGTPNLGGPLLTKAGLIFIGATADRRFRVFDSKTGEKLWTAKLPYDGSAAPMTFMHKGKQYIVIAAGGQIAFSRPTGDRLVAFALDK